MMVWTKEKPKKAGVYFRTTLWGRVVRQDVVLMNGILKSYISGCGAWQSVDKFDDNMYWYYVPIPDPPDDADWVKQQKKEKADAEKATRKISQVVSQTPQARQ